MATGKPLSRLSRKYSPGVFGYVRKQIVGKDKEERETEKTSVLQASGNLALRKYTAFYTRSCEDSVLFISTLAKDWSVVCIPSKENKGLYIPRCCVCVCVCVCVRAQWVSAPEHLILFKSTRDGRPRRLHTQRHMLSPPPQTNTKT